MFVCSLLSTLGQQIDLYEALCKVCAINNFLVLTFLCLKGFVSKKVDLIQLITWAKINLRN